MVLRGSGYRILVADDGPGALDMVRRHRVDVVFLDVQAGREPDGFAVLEQLRARFPDVLARHALPWSVKVDEAQSHGRTIFEWAPRSPAARALAAIADELLARGPAARAA